MVIRKLLNFVLTQGMMCNFEVIYDKCGICISGKLCTEIEVIRMTQGSLSLQTTIVKDFMPYCLLWGAWQCGRVNSRMLLLLRCDHLLRRHHCRDALRWDSHSLLYCHCYQRSSTRWSLDADRALTCLSYSHRHRLSL